MWDNLINHSYRDKMKENKENNEDIHKNDVGGLDHDPLGARGMRQSPHFRN